MNIEKITIQKLQKTFVVGDQEKVSLFNSISFCFKKGGSYAITGSSGSGKTTLLHILATLDTPSSGFLFYDDIDVQNISSDEQLVLRQQLLGLMFQSPYLIAELSILQNCILKALIAHVDKKVAERKAVKFLKIIGLENKINKYPSELSGGQQQRVALIRALLCQPDFFIADEPTADLDELTVSGIVKLLITCQKKWNMGIIVSSHDSFLIEQMDTVLHLDNGMLKEK